jgi:twitching motility protein PilT
VKSIEQLLGTLARPEVIEFGLVTDRLPSVNVGGRFEPVADEALSTARILAMLSEIGGADIVKSLTERPVQWTTRVDGVGSVAVTAVLRGDVVQARFTIRKSEARPPSLAHDDGDDEPTLQTPSLRASSLLALDATASLDVLLALAVSELASDLHVVADGSAVLRIGGELVPRTEPLTAAHVERLARAAVPARLREVFERDGSCTFAFDHPTHGRFRAHVFLERAGARLALRPIPRTIPSLAELGLAGAAPAAADEARGVVVVSGLAGSGKSTTLAALVEAARARHRHIVSIADPIEHVHPVAAGLVTQREIGTHVSSYAQAVDEGLELDVDVFSFADLDADGARQAAIVASEAGVAVFATLNAPSAEAALRSVQSWLPPGTPAFVIGQRLVANLERGARSLIVDVLSGA